ncbi:MAG: rubredoxin [Dehalococcoidia bacterium]|nr:rubredoxin [Dehalococcoidia bacterium]
MRRLKCSICGYIYDEAAGITERGIAPGTKWEDVPEGFKCPLCGAPKSVFKPLEDAPPPLPVVNADDNHAENLKELSQGEISAICSSLAKGCEKQRLLDEMAAFNKIADYFKAKTAAESNTLDAAAKMLDEDLSDGFSSATAAAKTAADRGAMRSLVWSEKVSIMMKALLDRFAKEGDAMLENTTVWVCDICGFIYIGDTSPEICPVCKVPKFKIIEVERR